MKMIYIAPINLMRIVDANYNKGNNMLLAHMVLGSKEYATIGRELHGEKFLDNSFFELGKALSVNEILEAAKIVGATTVICEDGTLNGFTTFKKNGYKVMAIPTTVEMFNEYMLNEDIDFVGVSAIHFKSRYNLLLHNTDDTTQKKIHILGSGDSMWEFGALSPFKHCITSCDTSAPIWQGHLGNLIRDLRVKDRTPVDFSANVEFNLIAQANIDFLEEITK